MTDQFNWDSGQKDGGASDHGALTGLGDDDHAQYLNEDRHDSTERHSIPDVVPHDPQKADVADIVHNTGDETVSGVKTFTSIPLLPSVDPSLGNQAVNKDFVDKMVEVKAATVYLSADQEIANNSYAYISWNKVAFDNASFWSPSLPTRFTIPEDGLYDIKVNIFWRSNSVGKREHRLYYYRSSETALALDNKSAIASSWDGSSMSVQWPLLTGDEVYVKVLQDSGSPLDLYAWARAVNFSIRKVG